MGTYFNPRNVSFTKDINNEIYIDKTLLIRELNKLIGGSKNCVSLSHARRFGKSQAAAMIDAYYSVGCDSKELFSEFAIGKEEDFEKHLNRYNVIHIDVSSMADFHKEDLVEYMLVCLYDELKKVHPDGDYSKTIAAVLMEIYEVTGRQFVIILDEWDCVVRNCAEKPELVHEYLQLLHSLFKSEEAKSFLALAYITGILPIKKVEDESALNNFTEYTMTDSKKLTPFFGFTEEEVRALCREYNMEFDSVKSWYNGYLINGQHMYNPNSVYQAMVDHAYHSYWKNTSAFSSINRYISMNFDGLKEDILTMLKGDKVLVNIDTFCNDLSTIGSKDEALTALIHLGYLAYDAERKMAYIPNYEVATAFQAALATGKWKEIARTIEKCDELLWATIDKNAGKVAELIELAHESYTSVIKYNDENSLSCTITMAYFTAPAYYNVVREFPSGKGFADVVLVPRADSVNKPAMVIELKHDKDADTAIKQIKERRYGGTLKGYGEVLLVGIAYGKDKKHKCVIEIARV